ncbi:substrate-binding domain-containing protein [Blautia schinkii]|nr:substrate-binding domain-containing protein [Blautia schinkii]
MKKTVIITLTAAMTISAAAMTVSADDTVKIATIGVQSGGSYWGNIEQGFTAACEELGWEGDYWTPQNAGNDSEMVQLAENALTQGYDVICMEINDLDMYGDIIKRAKEEGVKLISLTDVGEENCDAFVGIDSYASGYSQGEQIAKFANELGYEEVNYVTLMSTTDNASQLKNREGIAEGIAANYDGKINEIDIAATDSNAATAQDKLSALYLANPELNAVGCADLYGALGAAQFVSENGLKGEFIATGLELTPDAFNRVLDGDLMATSSVDSVGIGKNFCYVAQKILNGEDYEYSNPAQKIWVMPDEVESYCKENGIELQ